MRYRIEVHKQHRREQRAFRANEPLPLGNGARSSARSGKTFQQFFLLTFDFWSSFMILRTHFFEQTGHSPLETRQRDNEQKIRSPQTLSSSRRPRGLMTRRKALHVPIFRCSTAKKSKNGRNGRERARVMRYRIEVQCRHRREQRALRAIKPLVLWNGARSSAYSGKPLPTYFYSQHGEKSKIGRNG